MDVKHFFVSLVLFPYLLRGQMQFPHPGQYGPPARNDLYQQQVPIHQQQIPIHQQQPQLNQQQPQINQQQPQINQQQPQINQQQGQMNQQQPQPNQQQPQLNQQQPQPNQQQPQINQQQPQLNQQQPQPNQQQPQLNQQQGQMNQQQYQMNQQQQYPNNPQQGGMVPNQQQYYQGNFGGFQNPSGQGYQAPPLANQFQQPNNPAAQPPSGPSGPIEKYLVGNMSEPFTFAVAPPSTKVTYIGLNGYSLYINNVGFSNRSKFSYDEQNNRLTVHSLDPTTVGYYTAVDTNWQTFVNILSAIDVSSLEVRNSDSNEDNNGSSPVSCSVSIIRSLFKLPEPPSSLSSPNNYPNQVPSSYPIASRPSSTATAIAGTENLPRLDLFFSTRTRSSTLADDQIYNDTLNGQVFTRTITSQRPLTRADHNGTIRCQVESNNNIDVFLIRDVPINIGYGPNLEAGALPTENLQSEALQPISLECRIEANPEASYVWYDIINNNNLSSNGMMSYYGQQNPYGGQYPLQPQGNLPTAGMTVFGTTRQIQRIYQNPGPHAMQCQAQSRGKTVKQHFLINVNPSSNGMNGLNGETKKGKSYKVPMIIGLVLGGIFLLLLVAIVAAALIFIKRRRAKSAHSRTPSMEKISNDKPGKPQWGARGNINGENTARYKKDVLRGDTSSTSHLVESAENHHTNSGGPPPLPPPIPSRGSPVTSTHSSYRQATVSVPLNYNQASSLPGFRPLPPQRSYSPADDDLDEDDSNLNPVPMPSSRSRQAPFGSRKSLTESIQSLKSNQQSALHLPTKKRSNEPPQPIIPKRDEKSASPKSLEGKKDYQHHHYHNPAQLRAQQRGKLDQGNSSEEEELQHQQRFDDTNEDAALLQKKFTFRVEADPSTALTGRKQAESRQQPPQSSRRLITPPPPQKIVVHQPTGGHHDEAPPSYHQVATPSAPSNPYAYQEPTEV